MKRRGFIAVLAGALGLSFLSKAEAKNKFVLPVRPPPSMPIPPCNVFIDGGTTIYIDPAIEGTCLVRWFEGRNQQLGELLSRVCDGNQ